MATVGGAGGGNSAVIAALVQQLKAKKITKKELFQQLSALPRGGGGGAGAGGGKGEASQASDGDSGDEPLPTPLPERTTVDSSNANPPPPPMPPAGNGNSYDDDGGADDVPQPPAGSVGEPVPPPLPPPAAVAAGGAAPPLPPPAAEPATAPVVDDATAQRKARIAQLLAEKRAARLAREQQQQQQQQQQQRAADSAGGASEEHGDARTTDSGGEEGATTATTATTGGAGAGAGVGDSLRADAGFGDTMHQQQQHGEEEGSLEGDSPLLAEAQEQGSLGSEAGLYDAGGYYAAEQEPPQHMPFARAREVGEPSPSHARATPAQSRRTRGSGARTAPRAARSASAPRGGARPYSASRSTGGAGGGGGGGGAGGPRNIDDLPFEERMMLWKQRQDMTRRWRKQEEDAKETEDCTFKPRINPNSRRTAARARSNAAVPVTERLYNHARLQQARTGTPRRRVPGSGASSAGSEDSATGGRFPKSKGAPLTQKELEELETVCTFKPKINKPRDATPVRSRYRSVTPSRQRPRSLPTGMEECTFTPHVNQVPKDMGLAQMYVRTGVFERLSKPRPATAPNGGGAEGGAAGGAGSRGGGGGGGAVPGGADRPIMDMTAFLSAMGDRMERVGSHRGRSASVGRGSYGGEGDDTASVGSRASTQTAGGTKHKSTRASFQQFLKRQNLAEERRKQTLEATRATSTFEHKPKLCAKSLKIAKTYKGSFLDRVAKDAMRKEHRSLRQKARADLDPECTFQPNINASAKQRPARSWVDMSRGDALKRETAQRLLRLKAKQEELEGLSFKPATNKKGHRNVEGRLKILSDPDTYIERVQAEAQQLHERQRQATQEAAMEEFRECTFKPKIHDAPAYVKRIARSMALAKAARPRQQNKRPDWR